MADEDTLQALKIAFTFMPQPVEVTKYEYGERADLVLSQINFVREVLASHGIDPDEVSGDINPDLTPNSCY
ncbi:MAG: penicillin-binding protein [Marinobacter sp.]|nr:penicillin-binding protein [Marinobacter sp.]